MEQLRSDRDVDAQPGERCSAMNVSLGQTVQWDSAGLIHFLPMFYYDLEKLGLRKEPFFDYKKVISCNSGQVSVHETAKVLCTGPGLNSNASLLIKSTALSIKDITFEFCSGATIFKKSLSDFLARVHV